MQVSLQSESLESNLKCSNNIQSEPYLFVSYFLLAAVWQHWVLMYHLLALVELSRRISKVCNGLDASITYLSMPFITDILVPVLT